MTTYEQYRQRRTEELRRLGKVCLTCDREIGENRVRYAKRVGGKAQYCWHCKTDRHLKQTNPAISHSDQNLKCMSPA